MRKGVVLLIAASTVALVVLAVVLVRDLSIRSRTDADPANLPNTAVVFTGQFDRVELALSLFDQGRLDQIFISGVNEDAGMELEGFADQFRISASALAALGSGQIILAPDANTTIENALETACWLEGQPGVRDIVLITSRFHMPRASLALETALAGSVSVRRLSPDGPGASDARSRWNVSEMVKFGATVLIILLPPHLWPGERPTSCM